MRPATKKPAADAPWRAEVSHARRPFSLLAPVYEPMARISSPASPSSQASATARASANAGRSWRRRRRMMACSPRMRMALALRLRSDARA